MTGGADGPVSVRAGLLYMVASCVVFALMTSLVYAVQLGEPEASVLVSSFVRIVVNLAILVVPALVATGGLNGLLGDRRPSLWARGVFGTLALTLSFTAIRAIGVGEASFLAASNGVFVAAMAPFVLKQRNPLTVWVAILGATLGLYLLFEPRLTDGMPLGRLAAIASGLFSALAYVMIARAGRSNAPETVIFYFCLTAAVLHVAIFATFGVTWPRQPKSWGLLAAAGILGSVAQVFLTKAYQTAPAALNSAVSYLGPVMNLLFGALFFAKIPDRRGLLGAGIVLAFGVVLPFVKLPAARAVPAARSIS